MKSVTGHLAISRANGAFNASFTIMTGLLPTLIESLHYLHDDELTFFNTIRFDKRRLSYLLGKYAAKQAIATFTGIGDLSSFSIASGVFHFPVIKHLPVGNVQVSISHCNNYALAISFPEEHPIGIDLEKLNEENAKIIETTITSSEKLLLINTSALTRNVLLWTTKEALSKILKTGLTLDFHLLEINSIKWDDDCYISEFKNFLQYKALSFIANGYICSIVLPRQSNLNIGILKTAMQNIVTRKRKGNLK